MGEDVGKEPRASDLEFSARLRRDLAASRELLARPGFGVGPASIGAELELSLIDDDTGAAMLNREVLEAVDDSRLTVELDRFNLEYNADPVPLAGQPFAALELQLIAAMSHVDQAARPLGARSISIGTLPGLELERLAGDSAATEVMTDLARYRELALALRSFRQSPFRLDITGEDRLSARCEGVTLEGANTSLQIHLRVDPDRFADTYNAAQLATPIALAMGGNSPLFCGHRLWDETRIAVFKQAVDIRDAGGKSGRPPRVSFGHGWTREGISELLAEAVAIHEPLLLRVWPEDDPIEVARAGGIPSLRALRLHLGTIWRWNRPIFDTSGDGHLRIELRTLPSGPTAIDMMASAAFAVGLTLGLRDRIRELICAVPFELVRTSFYRAAQHGVDAELAWPSATAPSPKRHRAADLALRLLPVAREGLVSAGVDRGEIDRTLGVIEGRARTGQTGARWQRAVLRGLGEDGPPTRDALKQLTLSYLARANTNAPVHTWPIP